jgi:putative acetyltransferase
MHHALAWLRRSNYPVVVLEGVPAYYPRFGFTSAHAMGILPPFALPQAAWQALRLPAYQATVQGVVHNPEPFAFLHPSEPGAE